MPGDGSIQGMINSLNNNKKLLRSLRLFKKEKTFLNVKKEYLKAAEGKLILREASRVELRQLREKIKKQRRKDNILIIAIWLIASIAFIYFMFTTIREDIVAIKNQEALEFSKKEKEFLSLIIDGDEWFKKGKWHNSIFLYEKAKEIFPKNYDVNYRLVRSYGFQCENDYKNCDTAKKLLDELLLIFPNKEKELLEIKEKLEYEY